MRGAHSAAAAALCLVASALGALAVPTHRELIQEVRLGRVVISRLVLVSLVTSAVQQQHLQAPTLHLVVALQLAPYKDRHITVPCSPSRVGSLPACYNASISAENNVDFTWGSPSVSPALIIRRALQQEGGGGSRAR